MPRELLTKENASSLTCHERTCRGERDRSLAVFGELDGGQDDVSYGAAL